MAGAEVWSSEAGRLSVAAIWGANLYGGACSRVCGKVESGAMKKVGLARALSKLGYCSRSRAAELIPAGRVEWSGAARSGNAGAFGKIPHRNTQPPSDRPPENLSRAEYTSR